MPSRPNHHVQQEIEHLLAEWNAGAVEGYDSLPGPLQAVHYKPYYLCTARERGYLFGQELKLREKDYE